MITSTTTYKELQDLIYLRLWQGITSSSYPLDLTKSFIKDWLNRILNSKSYPDRIWSYSYNKPIDWTTTIYSATELNIWTIPTYTPASWKILLGNTEIVDYSWVSATSFTWLTWLEIVYQPQDRIKIWHLINTEVKTISNILYNWYVMEYTDRRELIDKENRFTIIDGYIFLPYSQTADTIVSVNYVTKIVLPVDDIDIVPIDDDYVNLIAEYALYKLYVAREDDRYQLSKMEYDRLFREYQSYMSRSNTDWINKKFKSTILQDF